MQPVSNLRLLLLAGAIFASSLPIHAQAPNVAVVEVADTLSSAIGLANAGDGSGRLFVVQKTGQIRVWNGVQVLATPFLDLSTLVSGGSEQGLLGLAFHPGYAANGFFYVNYTDFSGDTVLARYSVSAGDPDVADPDSELIVLTFTQPATNHNGGDLHFGPDGYLYVSTGDGGGGGSCNAQNPGNLLGKILRIDVDGDDFPGDSNANYAVPADNPFVGVSGTREEIWSLGLRNPWRFSFDRSTGDLWIADVGAGTLEEIDFRPASSGGGENYGWPWFEGTGTFTSCPNPPGSPFAACGVAPFTCPVLTLDHADGNQAIVGGYRYRGQAYPTLRGFYFYTDWSEGTLWAAEPAWTPYAVADLGFGFTGFGEDEDGELYMVAGNRLVRVTDPTTVFADGFESGSTSAWSSTVP